MAPMNINIPESLKAQVDAEALKTGESLTSVITRALAQYLGSTMHTLFQVSTSGSMVAGVYQAAVTTRVILRHGNFGLGTFENLDGEMVVLDGNVYRVRADGRVDLASPKIPRHLQSSRNLLHRVTFKANSSVLCGSYPRSAMTNARPTIFSMPFAWTVKTLACGVPAIVTDFPGQADLVREGRCGLIIPDGDGDALARAVAQLAAHPEEARAMGDRGLELVRREHSWQRRAEQTDRLIASLSSH